MKNRVGHRGGHGCGRGRGVDRNNTSVRDDDSNSTSQGGRDGHTGK